MIAANKTGRQEARYEEVRKLEKRLLGGDLKAYRELKDKIDGLRLESSTAINAIAERRLSLKREIMKQESRKDHVILLQIALNLFGLTIVMLKDLPVWRNKV